MEQPSEPKVSMALRASELIVKGVGAAIGGALLALIAFGFWASFGVFSTSQFDSSAWFAKPSGSSAASCYRGGMARDIKNRLLHKGMSPTEVEGLLGKPDYAKDNEYMYTLGMCSGLGWDIDGLHVYFDSQRKMTKVAVIQH